jgi:hypothetical protein
MEELLLGERRDARFLIEQGADRGGSPKDFTSRGP